MTLFAFSFELCFYTEHKEMQDGEKKVGISWW